MTEEEIRPIAENYVEEYCHCSDGEYTDGSLVCAGIGTALIVSRQLEKQIQIDVEQIRALQKDNGKLTDRVNELEAQIEKMKCCRNCIHDIDKDYVIVQTDYCDNCFEFCNWVLRR